MGGRGRIGRASLVVALLASACARSNAECTPRSCDDHDPCNGLETCDAEGRCAPGEPMSCADSDPCTVDLCSTDGCAHVPRDLDGDGHADRCAGGNDCAPEDPSRFPGAPERCNEIDDDCDLEVDEGLPIELLEVEPMDGVGLRSPYLILDDDTRIGFGDGGVVVERADDSWTRSVTSWDEGRTNFGWWAFLADGDSALAAHPAGPLVVDPLDRSWDLFETIVIERLTPGADTIWTPIAEIRQEDAARPFSGRARWTAGGPTLLWSDQTAGRNDLRIAPMDESAESMVVATPHALGDFEIVASASATSILWLDRTAPDSSRLLARKVDRNGSPDGDAVRILEGVEVDSFECCAIARGAAITSRNLDDRYRFQLGVLDPQLRYTAWAGIEALSHRLRCVGATAYLSVSFDGRYHELWRLGDGGVVEVVDSFDVESARFVEGDSLNLYTFEYDPKADEIFDRTLRRYACAP